MILEIKDWFHNFEAWQKKAREQEFKPVTHLGVTYPGIAEAPKLDLNKLNILTGMNLESAADPFFRRYTKGDNLPTYIHSDFGMGTHTLILYLNNLEDCYGGTAFWTHERTGTLEVSRDMTIEEVINVDTDGNDEKLWNRNHLVLMEPNKLVLYDSARYHSRYPEKVEDDRLIYVWFLKNVK